MRHELSITIETTGWTQLAACRDRDPTWFFPAPGGEELRALAVCEECAVKPECLAYALEAGERYGIWGGTTQRHRRRLIARRHRERSS